jgi:hypothetical protein
MIQLNRQGRNRWVILTRRHAVKIPSLASWQDFLFGLLNNMKEAFDGRRSGRCPVVAKLPLGLAVVMPRAEPLDEVRFAAFDYHEFCRQHGVCAERKPDSFGLLKGEVVVLDYGWPPCVS